MSPGDREELLRRLVELQLDFLDDLDWGRALSRALRDVLSLTDSRFGVVGEVRAASTGAQYFELLDSIDVIWTDTLPARDAGGRHRVSAADMGPIVDRVVVTRAPVVVDLPVTVPPGHDDAEPRQVVGLPIWHRDRLLGVVAFGGRAAADARVMAESLSLYLTVCGGLLGAAKHQAQRLELEADLKAREDLYRDLFDGAGDLIHSVRPDGGFAYVNRAWRETLGFTADEAASLTVWEVVHPDHQDFYRTVFALAEPGTPPGTREMIFIAKDGRHIAVEGAEGCRFVDGVPAVTRAIFRDVTRRRAEEEALRAAMAAAEEAARAKSYFLANMSHELRTPMNAVIGMTQFLRDTPLTREQAELVGTMQRASESLLEIINNILDFSRIESGKLELECQPFDVRDAVEHAVDLVAGTASDKGIELSYALAPGLPAVVAGDVARFRQILINLLANAVKFTSPGDVSVSVEGHDDGGDYELYVRVRDTGIGIPPDRLDRLFQSFSQVDASTNRQFGGTGLGLAISRRLTELMGGTIWVESQPGVGSTFHFTVLTRPVTGAAASPLAGRQAPLADRAALVVAESPSVRRLLSDQATAWGMTPTAVATHEQALAEVRAGRRADLVVIDTQRALPEAIVLVAELRAAAEGRRLPVVLVGAMGTQVDAVEGLDDLHWLNKPIKQRSFYEVCLDALDASGARSSRAAVGATPDAPAPILRILLAEDNFINQQVATRMLNRLGHTADIAGNGREALAALERHEYDVLLLDVQMPEIDGFEVARRLRMEWPADRRPYIVGMTALALPRDRERCIEAGMDDYVSKPVRVEALQAALSRAAAAASRTRASRPAPPAEATPPVAAREAAPGDALVDTAALEQLRMLGEGQEGDFAAELVGRLWDELPNRLATLASALASENASAVERLAHTLKSSCGTVGAAAMAHVCQQMEHAAAAGDVAAARERLGSLRELAQATEPVHRAALQPQARRSA